MNLIPGLFFLCSISALSLFSPYESKKFDSYSSACRMLKSFRKALKRSLRRSMGLRDLPINKPIYGNHPFEDIIRLTSDLKREIKVVFDVGAHHGATSMFFNSNFPNAEIFAFEPHGPSLEVFRKNLSAETIHSFALALSDKSGQVDFHEYGNQSTINSLETWAPYAVRFDRKSKVRRIEVSTIDEFCIRNGINHISVLKIDAEGHDLAVMKRAKGLFDQRAIDFVLFEFNNFGTFVDAQGGSLNEIGFFLDQFGFQFVATYTDYIVPKKDIFVVANGLAVRK